MELNAFVKVQRKLLKLTQPEFARQTGVGLRFLRELEQGKTTLKMDKVNQVLNMFGYEVGALPFVQDDLNEKTDLVAEMNNRFLP